MKKNLILTAALMLSATAAMAQSGTFELKANLKNFGDTVIVWKGRREKMDTILVKKDKFTYTATLEKPRELNFIAPGALRGQRGAGMCRIIAVPGEKAELKGDVKSRYDITGSKFYQQYHQVDLMKEASQKKMTALSDSLNNLMKNGAKQEDVYKIYSEKMPALVKEQNEKFFAYIAQHANEEATATLVTDFEDPADMEKAKNMLSETIRNGRMKDLYEPVFEQVKKQKEMEEKSAKLQAAGVEAPDFTLKDIEGNDFTLSSLRGKYVILDFWGSWCGWCIKGMPQMKEYYKKYAGKFEIVGVDCNDTDQKWKDAVKKHELPWKHVYNPRANTEEEQANNVCGKYGITGFPTKIIISPEGKIVKTIVGEDPAFYTLLDELFSK
jgi:thiol-disulfide isomerase/thioredoxin